MGDMVESRTLCPESTLQCKELDEVTSEEKVGLAMKEQCELGEVQMNIRIDKLPIYAANKALLRHKDHKAG